MPLPAALSPPARLSATVIARLPADRTGMLTGTLWQLGCRSIEEPVAFERYRQDDHA